MIDGPDQVRSAGVIRQANNPPPVRTPSVTLPHHRAMTQTDGLPTSLKAGWGFGSVGSLTVLNTQSLLLLFFLTSVLGLAPAVAGSLLFGSKLVDAVLAPIVGARSDRTVSAMGRRRPFMLAGAIVSSLAVFGIFLCPVEGSAQILWIGAGLVLLALGYSLFNVAYIAMPAEMTDSPVERTSIMSWRIVFVSVGGLLTAFAPLVAKIAGGGRPGYGIMGAILGVIILVAMLVAVAASARARGGPPNTSTGGTFARFGVVFGNRPFMLLIAAKIMQLVGLASISASVLFLVKYVIGGKEEMIAAFGVASGLASIASMPLWVAVGKRLGKRNTFVVACVGFAAITLTWLLAGPGETSLTLAVRGLFGGIFSGGLLLMGQSILPDTIAYDCERSGERREGVYAGAYSFVEKASMALGPLLIGLILQSFGFVASRGAAVVQSAEALHGIVIGAAVMPALLYGFSIVPLLFYDLESGRRPVRGVPVPAQ